MWCPLKVVSTFKAGFIIVSLIMSNFHIIGDEDFYKSIRRYAQIVFGKFKFNGKWESPASTFQHTSQMIWFQ